MSDNLLELIDTDELLNELFDRFDDSVFIGIKNSATADSHDIVTVNFNGDAYACMGLTTVASHHIMRNTLNDPVKDTGPDPDKGEDPC